MMVQEYHALAAFVQRVRRGLTQRHLLQSGVAAAHCLPHCPVTWPRGATYCSRRAYRRPPVQSARAGGPRVPGALGRVAGPAAGLPASGAHMY